MSGGRTANSPRTVTARVMAILAVFQPGQPEHSLTEISQLTGLPASTVHRLLDELTAGRVLERGADLRYHVGPRLVQLATLSPDRHNRRQPTQFVA